MADVRIISDSIIGELGDGWAVLIKHFEWVRLSLAATHVGNARSALDDTIKYT